MKRTCLLLLSLALLFPACSKKNDDVPLTAEQLAEKLRSRGRATYMAQCISCHNVDPAKDGVLGPAVAGASRELLEAKLIRGGYPTGYAPKRPTKTMQTMPHLKNEIDSLTSFLNP